MKSCSHCLDAFQKKSSARDRGTAFHDMHLRAKRIMSLVFSTDMSNSKIALKCRRLLHKRLNFAFFDCDEHKELCFKLFKIICVKKYAESVLTFLNRILGGRILPKNTNRLSLPVKRAYECYLKTIRKNKRPGELKQCSKENKSKKL